MSDTLILRKFAIDMIKRSNLSKARLALLKSLTLDSTSYDTYILLGEVYYLSNLKDDALSCFLSAMHLQISKLINLEDNTLTNLIDIKFSKLPEHIKTKTKSKYGAIIFDDYTISEHIAHTFIDLKNDSRNSLATDCFKIFREQLITRQPIEAIIGKYSISNNDYFEFRQSNYIPLGREILVNKLNWEAISDLNVNNIYFK